MRWKVTYAALLAFIMGGEMAVLTVPSANAWRGYWAIGGEWLLVLVAAAVGWSLGWTLGDLVTKNEKRPACGCSHRRAKGCEVSSASRPEYSKDLGGCKHA